LTGGFFSCNGKEKPFLIIDETPIAVSAEASTYSIAISSNGAWTAVVEDAESNAWCTLTTASGSNSDTIIVNIAENSFRSPRNATVKITLGSLTKSVVINQEELEYPKDVPLTEYSFPPYMWLNLDYNESITIINNQEELKYYTGTNPYATPVDFSRHSLLIVRDLVGAAPCHGTMEATFFQDATNENEYTLKVAMRLGTTGLRSSWVVSYLIPRLPKDINVSLATEYSYGYYDDTGFEHDESASIIGKWKYMIMRNAGSYISTHIVDYSQQNIVYEFKEGGILIISSGTSVSEHSYSTTDTDDGNGISNYPGFYIKIDGRTHLLKISSGRMIIHDVMGDATSYFVKIN
jgi:hypothetical protein